MSQADGYIEIPAQTDIVEAGETRGREAVLTWHIHLDARRTARRAFELVRTRRDARARWPDFLARGRVLLAFHRGTW